MLVSLKAFGLLCLAVEGVCAAKWSDITHRKDIKLTEHGYSPMIKYLDKAVKVASVDAVIADPAAKHTLSQSGGKLKWSHVDFSGKKWWPQGISTSADAFDNGTYGKSHVMLASWYAKNGKDEGVRISFINTAPGAPKTYRHVLLVEPSGTAKAPSFGPVKVHAGGIAWYGDMLYVVDTMHGLRLFDMRHIYEVKGGNGVGRQKDGSYQAYGHKYVLPQVRHYKSHGAKPAFHYSYISTDRTTKPHSLVVGEWHGSGHHTRVAHFDLDESTFLVKTTKKGEATASRAYNTGYDRIQGVASVNNRYYCSQYNGQKKGDLIAYTPGATHAKNYNEHYPKCPEDMSYEGPAGTMWTLTEIPGARYIVGTQIKDFP